MVPVSVLKLDAMAIRSAAREMRLQLDHDQLVYRSCESYRAWLAWKRGE